MALFTITSLHPIPCHPSPSTFLNHSTLGKAKKKINPKHLKRNSERILRLLGSQGARKVWQSRREWKAERDALSLRLQRPRCRRSRCGHSLLQPLRGPRRGPPLCLRSDREIHTAPHREPAAERRRDRRAARGAAGRLDRRGPAHPHPPPLPRCTGRFCRRSLLGATSW